MFEKILIANRGEIALRIIRACREMGIATVAVYSQADQDALHVKLADESICIGPPPVSQSYLNMEALLSAAVITGAQAIHPGYGLLAENPRFADLCSRCNIVFIGPDAEVIRKMGNKDEARRTMAAAGVPVIPGSGSLSSVEEALALAEKTGYPVLLKARAGGGGRGIRKVNAAAEMEEAFVAASREAKAAFGDGTLYLEAFLKPVKHIEMQILCDHYGNVVCLGERDCSVQRNNQKLIEESPAPKVNEQMRQNMIKWSVQAAKATGYQGVGTIEYLLTEKGQIYFMEMNTRLQVEHPVTEMVTGIDLVKWQIRVAGGLPLSFRQEDIELRGHAIECRINAENPLKGFAPSCGTIKILHVPGGPGVRFDSAMYQDYTVPPYYDSLVGKLIVHGAGREEAIRKMQAALCELVIEGIDHTGQFQERLLAREEFVKGSYTTDFLQKISEEKAEVGNK